MIVGCRIAAIAAIITRQYRRREVDRLAKVARIRTAINRKIRSAGGSRARLEGIDLSEEAVEFACVEAEERSNKNASFIARDLSRFDQEAQPGTFDFITTFDAVHDQASP